MSPMTREDLLLKEKMMFPKILIYGTKYKAISSDAKLAYIILYNQFETALEKGWIDEKDNAFFKFNYGEMSDLFNWSLDKTKATITELETASMVNIFSDNLGIIQRIYLAELSL